MKTTAVLLAGSLVANAALFGALVMRPALAPPGVRDFFSGLHGPDPAEQKRLAEAQAAAILRRDQAARASASAAARSQAQLWATLGGTGDLKGLVAALRAAGFPPQMIRVIVSTEVNNRISLPRFREIAASYGSTPYWKQDKLSTNAGNMEMNFRMNQVYHEQEKLIRDLLGDDYYATSGSSDPAAARRRQYGDIPPDKIEQIQRIADDYSDMNNQVRASMQGIQLPGDADKFALLDREKHADLAAILTPEQLADYEMRTSTTTTRLRQTLTSMNATEAEFRTIYNVTQPFADKIDFPMGVSYISSDMNSARTDAIAQYGDALKAALGADRYEDFLRAGSSEYQQLTRLATAQNLPDDAATRAFSLRDTAADQSMAIWANPAMSADDKRAALKTLADTTRTQLIGILGTTAGEQYLQNTTWLRSMSQGVAVSFGPQNTTIVKPVTGPRK